MGCLAAVVNPLLLMLTHAIMHVTAWILRMVPCMMIVCLSKNHNLGMTAYAITVAVPTHVTQNSLCIQLNHSMEKRPWERVGTGIKKTRKRHYSILDCTFHFPLKLVYSTLIITINNIVCYSGY